MQHQTLLFVITACTLFYLNSAMILLYVKCYKWNPYFLYVMPGDDFESSLLSFEKLDRASPDLWPEQCKLTFSLLLWNYSLLNCG